MFCKNIIKYIIALLLLTAILHYVPADSLTTTNIFKIALLIFLFLIFLDMFQTTEGMSVIAANNTIPQWFDYGVTGYEKDYYKSGFEFNQNMPGYYLNYGNPYVSNPVTFEMIPEIIRENEDNRMKEQYNYEIMSLSNE